MHKGKVILILFTIAALAGCGGGFSDPAAGEIDQTDKVSECGGFAAALSPFLGGGRTDPDYCAAERLHWEYEPGAGLLRLANTRVPLNCCGVHEMVISVQEGVYVVTEHDDPDQGGRCLCQCVYDFTVEATGIPLGVIQVRLQREVSDWPEASGVIYEGQLDLSLLTGSIVVDETDVSWICGQ